MFDKAKQIINEADVLVVFAGAGMSADSGLSTYKDKNGVNHEYTKLTTQHAFEKLSVDAWNLHGQLYNSYRDTDPHKGYNTLLEIVKKKKNYFVVTSNVDEHFQKAGFDADKVYEIHGRMGKLQCTECGELWSLPTDTRFKKNEVPKCECGGKARPNVMMFNDCGFDIKETREQAKRFNEFMSQYDKGNHKIAVIEIGSGLNVPTIRKMGEYIQGKVDGATLIRINPIDIDGPEGTIGVKTGAMEAINTLV